MDLNLSVNEIVISFHCKFILDTDVKLRIQCIRVIPWTLQARQNSIISRLLQRLLYFGVI